MDARRAELIQNSYREILSKNGEAMSAAFYVRLFELFPEMKALFRVTDMPRQHRMFFDALAMVAENIHSPESLERPLGKLGERHLQLAVPPEFYGRFGKVLVLTLGEFMGDAWTPELAAAWSELYADTVSLMIGDIDVEEGS